MAETITYGGIELLRHKELYEVRKGKIDVILYYTRKDTGESGMSTQSLANACGIARYALDKTLKTIIFKGATKSSKIEDNLLINNEKEGATKPCNLNGIQEEYAGKPDDFYLVEANDAHIVRDIYCERVIYYYAFESHYKKAKARELYQALARHGLRVFIQNKNGYKPEQAKQHDNSTQLSIEEQLRKNVETLELQLVQQQGTIKEQSAEIENLKYTPHLEKTYQAYLHDMIGGIREFHVSGQQRPERFLL